MTAIEFTLASVVGVVIGVLILWGWIRFQSRR